MFQFLKKSAALIALVGLVGSAQADSAIGPDGSYDFGVLNSSQGVSVNGIAGDFDNTFSFTQGAFPAVTGALVGLDLYGDMEAQYRWGVGGTSALDATWFGWSGLAPVPNDGEGSFGFSQTVGNLTPNTRYWFELSGSASDAAYTVTLAPVPEPESWALMLAGLGLVAFIARRRRAAAVLGNQTMKKSVVARSIGLGLLVLSGAASANSLTFNEAQGSSFEQMLTVTPDAANTMLFKISGLDSQFDSLSFTFLGTGLSKTATVSGGLRSGAFNDFLNMTYNLVGGTAYHVKVSGHTRAGITGGWGTVSVSALNAAVAMVPEPESYAMLLAGLGLLGVVARRRASAAK